MRSFNPFIWQHMTEKEIRDTLLHSHRTSNLSHFRKKFNADMLRANFFWKIYFVLFEIIVDNGWDATLRVPLNIK